MRLSTQKSPTVRESVFVHSLQTRTAPSKNGLTYDGWTLGPIIFSYVSNNPLISIDPLGLAGCLVTYPGHPITIPGTSAKAPIAHAGVLSYDSNGSTRYFEYGRYDSDYGNVRERNVSDLKMGPDGQPTAESLAKLQEELNKIGNGTKAKMSCDSKPDSKKINDFAESKKKNVQRPPYSWNPFTPNTCITFANEALGAGYK